MQETLRPETLPERDRGPGAYALRAPLGSGLSGDPVVPSGAVGITDRRAPAALAGEWIARQLGQTAPGGADGDELQVVEPVGHP
jgi:hypothetical protein